MSKKEQLADRVGQIIFRLECNIQLPIRYQYSLPVSVLPAITAIVSDIEKLKEIKTEIEELIES